MRIVFLIAIWLSGGMLYGQTTNDITAIRTVLNTQEAAWNKGDIEGFMQGYWKHDSLIFIGSNGPRYGWENTLERYRQSYNTPEKMGQLHFTIINIEFLSKENCRVLGKWDLKRTIGDAGGYFTLVFRKFRNGWKIVYDHTS
jgi:ketosteroid isomerase-like protein